MSTTVDEAQSIGFVQGPRRIAILVAGRLVEQGDAGTREQHRSVKHEPPVDLMIHCLIRLFRFFDQGGTIVSFRARKRLDLHHRAKAAMTALALQVAPAFAQTMPAILRPPPPVPRGRTNENVVRQGQDAFGATTGRETIGIYSSSSVRGFSPIAVLAVAFLAFAGPVQAEAVAVTFDDLPVFGRRGTIEDAEATRPAFVLLLHASRLNAASIDAVARILRHQSLRFVTLDQALADPAYGIADSYAGPEGDQWLTRLARTLHKDLPWSTLPKVPDRIAAPTSPPKT